MTIYDIAKEAGVSASTVSRVINNRPGIKKETREKVLELVRSSNFSINEGARSLVNKNSGMIGILVSDIRNMHHIDGAYMISQHLIEKGYISLLMNTGNSDESKAEYIRILASRRVEAAVLIGSTFQNDLVKEAIEESMPKIPVVMQNGHLDLPNVSSVLADELAGCMDAVNWLYDNGKRKIAFVNNNDTPSNRKKIRGYSIAMEERNLEPRIIFSCEDSPDGGVDGTRQILAKWPDTEAIIYAVDILAVGACRYLQDSGYKVPTDISLIGMDNSIFSKIANPRLSTIDNKLPELSARCYEILSQVLEDGSYREHRVIMPSLLHRETTNSNC